MSLRDSASTIMSTIMSPNCNWLLFSTSIVIPILTITYFKSLSVTVQTDCLGTRQGRLN